MKSMAIALAIATSQCPLGSQTPLGPVSGGVINPLLLGVWQCSITEDEAAGEQPSQFPIRVTRLDSHQYLFVLEGARDRVLRFRVHSTVVGGVELLNVHGLPEPGEQDEPGYVIGRYALEPDGRLRLLVANENPD